MLQPLIDLPLTKQNQNQNLRNYGEKIHLVMSRTSCVRKYPSLPLKTAGAMQTLPGPMAIVFRLGSPKRFRTFPGAGADLFETPVLILARFSLNSPIFSFFPLCSRGKKRGPLQESDSPVKLTWIKKIYRPSHPAVLPFLRCFPSHRFSGMPISLIVGSLH